MAAPTELNSRRFAEGVPGLLETADCVVRDSGYHSGITNSTGLSQLSQRVFGDIWGLHRQHSCLHGYRESQWSSAFSGSPGARVPWGLRLDSRRFRGKYRGLREGLKSCIGVAGFAFESWEILTDREAPFLPLWDCRFLHGIVVIATSGV